MSKVLRSSWLSKICILQHVNYSILDRLLSQSATISLYISCFTMLLMSEHIY